MLPLCETILSDYKMRRTSAQKDAFIKLMQTHYPHLSIEQLGKKKSRNLIMGDIETAHVILTAHYDTSAASLFPNVVMPYRKVLRFFYTMLSLMPIILLSLGALFASRAFGATDEVSLIAFLVVYYVLFYIKMFCLPPNPSNDNDNTSGVVTLIETWEKLGESQRAHTALIFFDNEEYGCVGSKEFYKAHKALMEDKLLVNFDCVGDGKTMLLVLAEKAEKQYLSVLKETITEEEGISVRFDSKKRANHSSDHKYFPCGVAVSAMHECKWLDLHFGRIHTKRDTVMDRGNVAFLADRVTALVDRMTTVVR